MKPCICSETRGQGGTELHLGLCIHLMESHPQISGPFFVVVHFLRGFPSGGVWGPRWGHPCFRASGGASLPYCGKFVPRDITACYKVLEAGIALGVTKPRPGRKQERRRLGWTVWWPLPMAAEGDTMAAAVSVHCREGSPPDIPFSRQRENARLRGHGALTVGTGSCQMLVSG